MGNKVSTGVPARLNVNHARIDGILWSDKVHLIFQQTGGVGLFKVRRDYDLEQVHSSYFDADAVTTTIRLVQTQDGVEERSTIIISNETEAHRSHVSLVKNIRRLHGEYTAAVGYLYISEAGRLGRFRDFEKMKGEAAIALDRERVLTHRIRELEVKIGRIRETQNIGNGNILLQRFRVIEDKLDHHEKALDGLLPAYEPIKEGLELDIVPKVSKAAHPEYPKNNARRQLSLPRNRLNLAAIGRTHQMLIDEDRACFSEVEGLHV